MRGKCGPRGKLSQHINNWVCYTVAQELKEYADNITHTLECLNNWRITGYSFLPLLFFFTMKRCIAFQTTLLNSVMAFFFAFRLSKVFSLFSMSARLREWRTLTYLLWVCLFSCQSVRRWKDPCALILAVLLVWPVITTRVRRVFWSCQLCWMLSVVLNVLGCVECCQLCWMLSVVLNVVCCVECCQLCWMFSVVLNVVSCVECSRLCWMLSVVLNVEHVE